MKTRLSLVPLVVAVLLAGCATTHHVYPVSGAPPETLKKLDGVPYALPRTVLTVTCELSTTTTEKSIFTNVPGAEEYAKALDVKLAGTGATKYELLSAALTPGAEPDPQQVYLVESRKSLFQKQTLKLNLNRLGVITSGLSEVTDKRPELAAQIFETILGIGATARKVGTDIDPIATAERPGATPKRIYDLVMELRNKRRNLLAGSTPMSGVSTETLRFLLEKLNEEEKNLLMAFTGKEKTRTCAIQFTLCPTRDSGAGSTPPKPVSYTLLYCSPNGKFRPNAALNADSYLHNDKGGHLIDTPAANAPACYTALELRLKPIEGSMASLLAGVPRLQGKAWPSGRRACERSFRYRVPERVTAEIVQDGVVRLREPILVAQFGGVFSLPADLLGSRAKYDLKFFEDTGALMEIGRESDAIDPAVIKQLGAPVQGVLEQTGEAAQLQREVAVLELRKKKRDLEQAELKALIEAVGAAVTAAAQ